jgi:hypothetical protein
VCIEKQISRFEKELTPKWLPIWQEGLIKMTFDEPMGLCQNFRYIGGPTGPAKPPHLSIPSTIVDGPTNQIRAVLSEPVEKRQNFDAGIAPAGPGERNDEHS